MNIYDNTKLLTPEQLIALQSSILDITFDWINDSVDVFVNYNDDSNEILQVLIEDDEDNYFGYSISHKLLIEELEEYV